MLTVLKLMRNVVVSRKLCSKVALPQNGIPSWSVIQPFGSIRVNLTEAFSNGWRETENFSTLLESHMEDWRSKGHSAVWLHVPIPLCHLISVAADQGFTLHHGMEGEVVMSKWLQEHRVNRLPHYASHQVGVCGVVLREDTNELLVTQDKYKPPIWKFPGGVADFAEDINKAAIREVQEETGILTDFMSVLAFRQQHRLQRYFGLSDLYFICRMKPLTYEISRCQDEVLKCQWMEVEELATTKKTTPLSHLVANLLLRARDGGRGFKDIDIAMQEVEMNLPDYTTSKSYKLFMRTT